MKNKFLKAYLIIFGAMVFITSAMFMYEQINKFNLPKGFIYAIVTYGYLIIHLTSFSLMLYYGKESFISDNKKD